MRVEGTLDFTKCIDGRGVPDIPLAKVEQARRDIGVFAARLIRQGEDAAPLRMTASVQAPSMPWRAISTICRPMGREDVAAGEGTLHTCSILSACTN